MHSPQFCLPALAALLLPCLPVQAASSDPSDPAPRIETIEVSARLRREDAQRVPLALSVVGGATLAATNTINVAQLTQLAPSLNYSSPNPRNTALTIRGLGSSVVAVAQANDGLEPGVGFYVDQVYHARPATAVFDFLDLERVEVLRGPQGTLFGKNTTAGALNISTRKASFTPDATVDLTTGSFGYEQLRVSLNGPLLDQRIAGRLSLLSNRRDGLLYNTRTGQRQNDVDNQGVRAQLRFVPDEQFTLDLTADHYSIDTNCCTQVHHLVGESLRPAPRQYPALAATQDYIPASTDAYARLTNIDAPLQVMSKEGGLSAVAQWTLQRHVLTSVTAWRFWDWMAANDRDYTGLSIQTLQGIPSRQDQYSQELRISNTTAGLLDYTAGLYAFTQRIEAQPTTAYGPLAAFWLLGPEPQIPATLLDGYRSDASTRFDSDSYAVFAEGIWHLPARFDLATGLRYTREDKSGRYQSQISGGLATSDPELRRRQLSILRPQDYAAAVTEDNVSGRINLSWQGHAQLMPYVSWARGFKSGGINMSGLPLTPDNLPALATASIDPEENSTLELGFKSQWLQERLSVNVAGFRTRVRDVQANVIDSGPGALRGYLANIPEVRVDGVELDLAFAVSASLSAWLSAAWTDGRYERYPAAPCPLEVTSGILGFCDLSGTPLASLPQQSLTLGAQYSRQLAVAGLRGELWLRSDLSSRSAMSGEASNSRYTRLPAQQLVNLMLGFRSAENWELTLWSRNLFDEQYLQSVTVQAGNSGLVLALPGEPRMSGMTLRVAFGN
jgi:iron complex outermembrane receptor protein